MASRAAAHIVLGGQQAALAVSAHEDASHSDLWMLFLSFIHSMLGSVLGASFEAV